MAGSPLSYNVTADATTTTLVEVYVVSTLWISLGILSSCVLFLGGLLSVVFRHLATGPEVLGFASTVIRDSKYVSLPLEMGRIGGLDITKAMKGQRVRYGLTGTIQEGQWSAGVGLESETTRMKRNRGPGDEQLL